MSNSALDPFGSQNGFAAFMEQADADPAAAAAAPVAGEAAPAGGQAGGGGAPVVPAATPVTAGEPPATGADGAAGGAGAAAQPNGAAAPVAPEGTATGSYVKDPVWERSVVDQLGQASTAMAAKVRETARVESLAAMRGEYEVYFDAIEAAPRLLVGKTVPSLDPDKETEVLRDTNDARDYQEAAKSLLAKELQGRVQAHVQEQADHLSVISQSIDMLQQNPDLLRDKALADRVAALIKPYEYRKDGKLYGYSVNVIPLVAQVREQLRTERASGAAAPAAAPAPVAPAAPAPGPQQGLRASAAQQAPVEGFDQLWSTLGFAPGSINL